MVWMADEQASEIKRLEQLPLIDYWFLLNNRLARIAAAKAASAQKPASKPRK